MTFPGEYDGFQATIGDSSGSPWRNEISPGVFATVALHRPVSKAPRIAIPAWIGLGERDITVSRKHIARFAAGAPKAELHRYDVDHFEPFHGPAPAQIAGDQAAWLQRRFGQG